MENRSLARQAWTIARIELRRAFLSRRAIWVYALALFPAAIFFGRSLIVKSQRAEFSTHAMTTPALMDSIQMGEAVDAVLQRVGKTSEDKQWQRPRRFPNREASGITTHKIEPGHEARYVRLNIMSPTYSRDRTARIYEFEVYGEGPENLALNRPATGSTPCGADEGPEKAFNGSVKGGTKDRWCSHGSNLFLQVDLGQVAPIKKIVIKHASAGGESDDLDTRWFNIQAGRDNQSYAPLVQGAGARMVVEMETHRTLTYFDGRRQADLEFVNGKLDSKNIRVLLNFEEDRQVFSGVFQYFYLRLAIFFGCLGIFMNLFRGEMLDKTLHFWFLAPARREVLLAGKYGAGLIASTVIFAGGALLCFGFMLWPHNPIEVQAYWQSAGATHLFWYAVASVLGCIGYGSVFLATGLLMRNPIIPAAVILGWESINGFLPDLLQKLSILYYLQSLCPVPAPMDDTIAPLLKLFLSPAAPASHTGAILGLLVVSVLVLWIARFAIRRMQVTYSTEG
jgi:ABC-type transport system involved in multi-copper enzyme maturation permease subunit